MRTLLALVVLLAVAVSPQSSAEELRYAVFPIEAAPTDKPIVAGIRKYALKDVKIEKLEDEGWDKSLPLGGGFTVGIRVIPNAQPLGFGIRIENQSYPYSASWNWFSVGDPDVFVQLQGGARVRATYRSVGGLMEIVAVEFLDDTTLTFLDDLLTHKPGTRTHKVVVTKGSTLRVAPN